MSRKQLFDKSLLYDTQRIEELNNQLKKSSVYSNYIWTGSLHAINKTPRPDMRPEFQKIKNELSKYKDKNSKFPQDDRKSRFLIGATAILQTDRPHEPIDELFKKRLESIHVSSDGSLEPFRRIKKFENIYKDTFEKPPQISTDAYAKNLKFINSIINIKREINHEPLENIQRKVRVEQKSKPLILKNRKK